jgi:hypothetical protein
MTDRRKSRRGRLSLSSVDVAPPANTLWRDAVSAGLGWSMMFTIYPKVGSVRRQTEEGSDGSRTF